MEIELEMENGSKLGVRIDQSGADGALLQDKWTSWSNADQQWGPQTKSRACIGPALYQVQKSSVKEAPIKKTPTKKTQQPLNGC
ncbi:MAG TPA: hypothetical protein VMH83_13020 [Candidatus Acidoferrum sp.]|nr:hypothetical protein [Candidatus Acidoferrum sp.]